MFLLSVALLGLGGPVMSAGLPKVIAESFTGSRRALASGVYVTGAQVGQMSALALTNVVTVALGDAWRSTLQIYAVVVVALAFVWVIFARDSTEAAGADKRSAGFFGELKHIVRVPGIWAVVVIGLSGFMASHGYRSWLPEMLMGKGIPSTTAGFMAAIPALFGLVGSVVIVRFASHRSRKLAIIVLLGIVGATILVAVVATGILLLVALALEGFCAAALLPLMMIILMDMPLVGSSHMGAAAGLYFSVGEVGGFIGPSLIGSLTTATGSFFAGMLVVSAFMWLMIVPAIKLRLPTTSSAPRIST
jgi:cyanate permease